MTPPKAQPRAQASSLSAIPRGHAADQVFERLASAIVQGELPAGEPLPPERVLAERFAVSRLIVRQALHRLAELKLVEVRQGGATQVLDPEQSTDIRLIGLYYRLDQGSPRLAQIQADMLEKQYMQGLSLVDIAARRGSAESLSAIHELALAFPEYTATEPEFQSFEAEFWRAIAKAGNNQILQREVAWWYEVLEARPVNPNTALPIAARIVFHRELARRLAQREGATEYYLQVVSPILAQVFAASPGAP